MKALSLKQPYASMVAEGEKTIETRKWRTMYRGPVLICVCKKPKTYLSGYAIAVATIVNCRPMTEADESAACCGVYPRAQSWELADIRKIQPIPVRGALGVFECPVEMGDLRFLERADAE